MFNKIILIALYLVTILCLLFMAWSEQNMGNSFVAKEWLAATIAIAILTPTFYYMYKKNPFIPITIVVMLPSLFSTWVEYTSGDYSAAIVWLIVTLLTPLFIYLCIVIARKYRVLMDRKSKDKLLEWIIRESSTLKISGDNYEMQYIDKNTVLTRFSCVISVGFVTTKSITNYYVKGTVKSVLVGSFCNIVTFFLGWWGIPYGPIYTVQVLFNNIFGRENISVEQLI